MKCSLKLLTLILLISSCTSTRPGWAGVKSQYYVKLIGGNQPLIERRKYLRWKKAQQLRRDSASVTTTNDY